MAEALVGPTVKVLLERLLSLSTDNIGLVFGFKKDVETLRESVAMIQSVLADAEKQQLQRHAVKLWLKKLEDAAYEADNVFDELSYEMLRHKVCFSSSNTNIAFRWRMARKIRDINIKLRKINDDATSFGLQTQLVDSANTINSGRLIAHRETDSSVERNVVGRGREASMIVKKLLSPSSEVVSFIPIIGMGGLGKTSFAQLVHNNKQIEKHFDKRIWVCVSDDFDVTRILKLILESLIGKNVQITAREVVVQKIKQELEGKRYFLVLDDVWEENPQLWSNFLRSLSGISKTQGNWCIVTTRNLQVATNLPACHPLYLEKLEDDDCWSIVKEKCFFGEEGPAEVEVIREKVTTLCRGVPLVASVIGGLLRGKAKKGWLSVVDKELLNITRHENYVLQILELSFDHLPSPFIKKCFAYCSLFRKDTEINKEQLIQLWMAEGFLQPNVLDNEMMMEEIGYEYLSILVQSSLLEEVRSQRDGIICCRMHDFVHDLALSVSKSEMVHLKDGVLIDEHCRGRYFVASRHNVRPRTIFKDASSSLRTLFLKYCVFDGKVLNFKYLRTLNLSGTSNYKKLPTSIKKLIHLRYLDISDHDLKGLPESLCKLYHLQTLRLPFISQLPKGMRNLICLRHLYYYNRDETFLMPKKMGNLTCLQTLKFFNVGQKKGRRIEELGYLRNLRGDLEIRNLEAVNGKEDAERANLVGKPNLLKLKLVWDWSYRRGENHDGEVLEVLQPHPSLQELTIEGYRGTKLPSWLPMNTVMFNDQRFGLSTRALNNLVKLSLTHCRRCREIPTLGHLQFLERLELSGFDEITCIGPSFYGLTDDCNTSGSGSARSGSRQCLERRIFPALESLEILFMENLIEWSQLEETTLTRAQVFPKLENLSITGCPKLTTAPSHFPSLKKLRLCNVEELLPEANICSKVTTLESVDIEGTGGFKCIGDVVFNNNTNLLSLRLHGCPVLTEVQGCSSSLQRLEIFRCKNFRELPEDLLKFYSLEELETRNCPNLRSTRNAIECTRECELRGLLRKLMTVPKLSSSSLRKLSIGPLSEEFDCWLSSLSELNFYGWPHLESPLPHQLQYLTSLTKMELWDWGFEALPDWFENFVSLQELYLNNCAKLRYFPSMAAMRRLSNLYSLHIYDCPLLKERCKPTSPSSGSGTSSEWFKISHIPNIRVHYKFIQYESRLGHIITLNRAS